MKKLKLAIYLLTLVFALTGCKKGRACENDQ